MGGAQTAALLGFHRLKFPKLGLCLGFTSGELPVAPAAGDGPDAFFLNFQTFLVPSVSDYAIDIAGDLPRSAEGND